MSPEPPYCPPAAGLASGPAGHLLCRERHDRDGSRQAWVSRARESGSRPVRNLVCVPAASLTQLEDPDACRQVPRRVLGKDGQIRPWRPGQAGPAAASRGSGPVRGGGGPRGRRYEVEADDG